MRNLKNTLALAVAASTLAVAAPAIAQDTGATIGFIGGFTGPIESLTPPIFAGAELVVQQVNEQGGILGGELKLISADGGCDATIAAAAADKVINTDNVRLSSARSAPVKPSAPSTARACRAMSCSSRRPLRPRP